MNPGTDPRLAPRRAAHVFLVRSPLQFLLATALAGDAEPGATGSRVLFVPSTPDADRFLRLVSAWPESPFAEVRRMQPLRAQPDGAPKRRWQDVRQEIGDFLSHVPPATVTVFNDRQDEAQMLLMEAARRFPAAERRCAEDGALSYTGFAYPAVRFEKRLRQRWRFGRHWSPVRILGTHPLVQRFLALEPELLRDELRGTRPLSRIPVGPLSSDRMRSLGRRLCADAAFDPASVPAGAAIVTLNHSEYVARNPSYLGGIQACVRALVAEGVPIFVKYHPREHAEHAFALPAADSMVQIPRALPAEAMFLALRDRPVRLLAGISTTLITARLLMPQAVCLAVTHESSSGDAFPPRLLQALDIRPFDARPRA